MQLLYPPLLSVSAKPTLVAWVLWLVGSKLFFAGDTEAMSTAMQACVVKTHHCRLHMLGTVANPRLIKPSKACIVDKTQAQ